MTYSNSVQMLWVTLWDKGTHPSTSQPRASVHTVHGLRAPYLQQLWCSFPSPEIISASMDVVGITC